MSLGIARTASNDTAAFAALAAAAAHVSNVSSATGRLTALDSLAGEHEGAETIQADLRSRSLNSTAAGQEGMPAGATVAVFYFVLAVLIGSQYVLLWWKKKHKRSYERVTLVGLWTFPAAIAFHLRFWRFCAVWAAWSAAAGWLLSLCFNRRQLARSTPARVYAWFLGSHKASVGLGVAGYALLLVEVLGGGPVLAVLLPPGTSLLVLWYGLYFGVLGRDVAEVASDGMAAVMGSGRQLAVSLQDCGICGSRLPDHRAHLDAPPAPGTGGGALSGREISGGSTQADPTASVQLACKHLFHPLCIRGWTLVGKKSVCPVCLEKVDLRHLYAGRPWETRNLSWVQMLDALRYIIVWNPLLLFGAVIPLLRLLIRPLCLVTQPLCLLDPPISAFCSSLTSHYIDVES